MSQFDALSIRMLLIGVKWYHINCTNTRVTALVGIHVDMLKGCLAASINASCIGAGAPTRLDDKSVMIFVSTMIEEINPTFSFKTAYYLIYYVLIALLH